MTVGQIFSYCDSIKPNAFSNTVKALWMSEVEAMVQLEVMLLSPADVISYDGQTDLGHELLADNGHVKIYYTYLSAMIDFANGEYARYENSIALFNESFTDYMRWYAEKYRPADGYCERDGYYISAYAIAVKHGFRGSEAEWVEGLGGSYATLTRRSVDISQCSSPTEEKNSSFTLDASHEGRFIICTGGSDIEITVPNGLNDGFEARFLRYGAHEVAFIPASGVTLVSPGDARSIGSIYGCASLKQISSGIWSLSGNIA